MPPVLVCRGCDDSRPLRRHLRAQGLKVRDVDCQKICQDPVAACVVNGRVEWFSGLGKGEHRRALARLAGNGGAKIPGVLEKRRVAKRSGKAPR